MNLISLQYLMFLAVAALVYYALPKKFRWTVLLVASVLFFVLCGSPWMIAYLLAGTAACYGCALAIGRDPARRKLWLFLGIGITLGELIAFKYLNFFLVSGQMLGRLFGVRIGGELFSFAAPIGISYYTLSLIGYMLDVYWGTHEAERNPLKLLLFASFFPQLTSGPCTRYVEVSSRLFGGHAFSEQNVMRGLYRIFYGLFKKLVIAETMYPLIGTIFGAPEQYPGMYIVVATVFYAIYIYLDFSGCMDIVLGSAWVFGVKLPENFRQPFFSQNLSEFWRRWHIQLGLWFRTYIMYPLLKSDHHQRFAERLKKRFPKKTAKKIATYCGTFVLWILIGFWHSGSYKYIFTSGIIPFVYMIGGELLQPVYRKLEKVFHANDPERFSRKLFCCLRTFLCMMVIFLFVNAANLPTAFAMLKSALCFWRKGTIIFSGELLNLGISMEQYFQIGIGLLVVLYISARKERGDDVCLMLQRQGLAFRWLVYLIFLFGVLLLMPSAEQVIQGFVYAQF